MVGDSTVGPTAGADSTVGRMAGADSKAGQMAGAGSRVGPTAAVPAMTADRIGTAGEAGMAGSNS
jgi:hypothetical protein